MTNIKNILNNAVSLIVVMIVLLLIIPISPFFLDVMIILNISVGLIILLISMNIKEALEFSIFPSLLLITTLYRIGINVSTTRSILSNGGSAGSVIGAMGNFVLQGNAVVGVVIFLIIVLVQFLVINKGAERVAEVAARFTLDAMPGKQMAIDADLGSGLIDEQEAKARRYKIQKEADFYGAMDGATKIVKGDATLSLVTTAINFLGGCIIGMVQGGMTFTEVLSVYSIATIGDGLVGQIPALLISTATGMIVTRAVAEDSLNIEVLGQFKAQPRAIMIAGGVLAVLIAVPGMPKFQLAVIALVMLFGGYYLLRRMEEMGGPVMVGAAGVMAGMAGPGSMEQGPSLEEEMMAEEENFKDINTVYSLINVEPIEMEFGYSLIPLVDEASGGKMIDRIVIFRRQYAQEMGLVIPSIRLRDSSYLNTNQYVIKIKGEEVAKGEILIDYYLALEPPNLEKEIDGIDTIEPAYGIPSKWITMDKREMAEIYGYTVIDPLSVMLTHLSETVKKHAHELLNRQEVVRLIDNLKNQSPELVEEAIPAVISYGGSDEPAQGRHPDQGSGDDHRDDRGFCHDGEGSGDDHGEYPCGIEEDHYEKVLRRRQHEGGDAGRGPGKEYYHKPDEWGSRPLSGAQSGCDAECDHTAFGRGEEVPRAGAAADRSDESGGEDPFLSFDRAVLPGDVCAVV